MSGVEIWAHTTDLAEQFREDSLSSNALVGAVEGIQGCVGRKAYVTSCDRGEFRFGRTISTAFVDSLVNAILNKRFRQSQRMQWITRGAHLMLQLRTKLANGELAAAVGRWYQGMEQSRFISLEVENGDKACTAEAWHVA